MKKLCFTVVLVSLIVTAFPVLGADLDGKTVTVPSFSSSGKTTQNSWLKVGLSDMILNDLAATGKLDVVPRKALDKIMEEQKVQQSGAIDKKTAVKIGKLVGANLLISGNYQLIDGYIRINATTYDVQSGKSLGAANVSGNVDKVFKLEKLLVSKLLENIGFKLSQEERINLLQIQSKNVEALEKNYLGEMALDQGNEDQAEDYFKQAKELDPGFRKAQKNLDSVMKVDSQNLASKFQQKFKKAKQGQKLEKQHKQSIRDLAIYSAKNIWNIKKLPLRPDEDLVNIKADGSGDLKARIKITWNYNAVKKIVDTFQQLDSKQGNKELSFFYKTRNDNSTPRKLSFKSYESAMKYWGLFHHDYGDYNTEGEKSNLGNYFSIHFESGYFLTRVRLQAISKQGAVLGKSQFLSWHRSSNWGYQAYGDYQFMNGSDEYSQSSPSIEKDLEDGYLLEGTVKNISGSKIKQLKGIKLTEPEVYIDDESQWVKFSKLEDFVSKPSSN